jgi:type III pantothenate kinase
VNLIVEQGNSFTKVAVYHNGRLEISAGYKECDACALTPFFAKYNLQQGIMSTVAEPQNDLLAFLRDRLPYFIFFDATTAIPIPIDVRYQTPDTLGKDRLAAVVGAACLHPGKDILVIDAGTAITYEILESAGIYIGGNISPGMETRFKALNYFTKRLPLVSETEHIPLIGNTTETAIQAGVVNGILYEMEGYIHDLRRKYPYLLVFLTGGHSFYFAGRLKKPIFADRNLALIGLNRILEYNVDKQKGNHRRGMGNYPADHPIGSK